jgi:hypothetical protein
MASNFVLEGNFLPHFSWVGSWVDSLLPTPLPAAFRYTRYYEEFPAATKVSSVTFAAPPSLSAESGAVIDAGITMSDAKAAVSATGESASPLPSLHQQVPQVIIPTLPLVTPPLPLIVEINDGSGSAGASSRFIELPRVSVWRGSFMLFKSTGATSTSGSSHSGGGGGGSSSREKKREAKAVVDRFVLTLEAPSSDVSDSTTAPVPLDAVIARGEGGCALGAYELLGNLRLDADGIGLICSCIRSYTGAPKVRSPARPRPSSVSRHTTSSTDADAVAAAAAAAAALAPRASGRVRIKSRLYDDGIVEDEGGTNTGTGLQGGRNGSGGGVETIGVDGTGGGGGGIVTSGSSKKRKSTEFGGHGGEGGGGEGTITGGGREGKIGRSGKKSSGGVKSGGGSGGTRLGPLIFPGRDETPGISVFWAAHLWSPAGAGTGGECIYEGEVLNGVPHGRGTLVYPNGLMFEGSWNAGRETGWGVLCGADDEPIWAGEVVDGVPHGSGALFYSNGDSYAGAWKEGLPHGRGCLEMSSGNYDGAWVEGQRSGVGTQVYSDGSIYSGTWRAGHKHGRGELTTSFGFRYQGTWVSDVMEGKGEAYFPDGGRYEGSFKGGRREGRGTYTFPHSQQVSGRWISDDLAPDPIESIVSTSLGSGGGGGGGESGGGGSSGMMNVSSHGAGAAGAVVIPRSFLMSSTILDLTKNDVLIIPINLHQEMRGAHRSAGFSDEGS